jgi:predicted aconitase
MNTQLTLSAHEQEMLDGNLGKAKQKALELIVRYAKAVGAQRLVEIKKAHIFIGAHHYLHSLKSDDIDEIISEMYLNSSETTVLQGLSCFTQTDARPFDPDRWQQMGVSPAMAERDTNIRQRFRRAGASEGGSCVPYLIGFVPLMGEHYVSTESHALLFMNSMWGARANADSIEASICSAVCGRTPEWGNHVTSCRRGTHVVSVETKPRETHDWDLLGYVIGERLPSGAVPVLTGEFEAPQVEALKSCFASMSTSGSVEMCHIVGLTPEAPTLEAALQNCPPAATITITDKDIQEARARVSKQGPAKISFVSLGCPHYSLKQIQEVAAWLRDRVVHPSVILRVWTAIPIRESAVRSGYVADIERAGGAVLTSTCPLVSQTIPDVECMAFDSVKQGKYVSACTPARVFVGPLEQCLNAAVTGEWTATWQSQ